MAGGGVAGGSGFSGSAMHHLQNNISESNGPGSIRAIAILFSCRASCFRPHGSASGQETAFPTDSIPLPASDGGQAWKKTGYRWNWNYYLPRQNILLPVIVPAGARHDDRPP